MSGGPDKKEDKKQPDLALTVGMVPLTSPVKVKPLRVEPTYRLSVRGAWRSPKANEFLDKLDKSAVLIRPRSDTFSSSFSSSASEDIESDNNAVPPVSTALSTKVPVQKNNSLEPLASVIF